MRIRSMWRAAGFSAVVLGGVSLSQAASVQELEAKARMSEEAGLKAGFQAVPMPAVTNAYALTDADKAAGAILFRPSYENAFRGQVPAQDQVGGAWEMPVARGEISSLLLAAHAVEAQKGLVLRVKDGTMLPPLKVELLPLIMAPLSQAVRSADAGRMGDLKGSKTFLKAGVWLADPGAVDVGKGESRAWVVRVSVPRQTPTSVCAVPLELAEQSTGKVLGTATLNVRVLPFELVDPWERGYYFGIYFGGRNPGFAGVEALRQVKEHGVDAAHWFWSGNDSGKVRKENVDGKIKLSFDGPNGLDETMDKLMQAGFRGPIVLTVGTASEDRFFVKMLEAMGMGNDWQKPEAMAVCIEGFRQLFAHAREKKWPEIVIMTPDEPTEEKSKMKRHHAMVKMIHDNLPGVRVYGCTMDTLAKAKQVVDADILVCNGSTDEIVELGRQEKKTVWAYGSGTTKYAFECARSRYGLNMYTHGVTGMFFWSIGYGVDKVSNPYNDFEGKRPASMWNIAWPSPTEGGPFVLSHAFEKLRDGVYDVRYAMTLEKLLEGRTDDTAQKIGKRYAALRAGEMRETRYMEPVRAQLVGWILDLQAK